MSYQFIVRKKNNYATYTMTARNNFIALIAFAFLPTAGCGTSPKNSPDAVASGGPRVTETTISQCRPVPTQPKKSRTPYRVNPGARVVLSDGTMKGARMLIETNDGEFRKIPSDRRCDGSCGLTRTYDSTNYTVTGPKSAATTPFACSRHADLLFYPLCVVGVSALAIVGGAGVDIAGGMTGGIRKASFKGDVASVSGKTTGKSTAKRKAAEKSARTLAERLVPLRSLVRRVQRYSREHQLGELPVIADPTLQLNSEQPHFLERVDYVFEITVSKVVARRSPNDPGAYSYHITGLGRLVQVDGGAVVDEFTAHAKTWSLGIDLLSAEFEKSISKEFDSAFNNLAKAYVEEWIKPALQGSR